MEVRHQSFHARSQVSDERDFRGGGISIVCLCKCKLALFNCLIFRISLDETCEIGCDVCCVGEQIFEGLNCRVT